MSLETESNCTITNLTKSKLPRLPFLSMKEVVLGNTYNLSLVFAYGNLLKMLNRTYRNRNTVCDILSFPLSESAGEIFISLNQAQKEAKKFGRNFENFVGFLFIHGLAHLEGLEHGSRMEAREKKFRRKFGI